MTTPERISIENNTMEWIDIHKEEAKFSEDNSQNIKKRKRQEEEEDVKKFSIVKGFANNSSFVSQVKDELHRKSRILPEIWVDLGLLIGKLTIIHGEGCTVQSCKLALETLEEATKIIKSIQ
jgi:hypothetical protein